MGGEGARPLEDPQGGVILEELKAVLKRVEGLRKELEELGHDVKITLCFEVHVKREG